MPRSRSRSRSPRRRSPSSRHHRSRREDEPRRREKDDRRDKPRREARTSSREKDDRRPPREKTDRGSREPDKPDERLARRGDPRARLQQLGRSSGGPGTGANADSAVVAAAAGEAPVEKEAPNFAQTGLLAAATNTVNGVVLKYSEPAEARKPPGGQRWRLFVFKDREIVDTVDLNANSCWLVGRDRAVADLPVDHPSCSKQHAVIQFRYVTKVGEFGDREGGVRPYVMDLESANGTRVGKVGVPGGRYLELKEGDLITFGLSTREYILMLEKE